MGIKDIISRWRESKSEGKEKFKSAEEERKIQRILDEREKSSNRRELERFMKEKEEETIKEQLEIYRKERQEDIDFGHSPLGAKNIFKGQKKLFTGKPTITGGKKLFFTHD